MEQTNQKNLPDDNERINFISSNSYVSRVQCTPNVDAVYKIVNTYLGPRGTGLGSLPGELNKRSMQQVIDLMIETTCFSSSSRFIDVGSGIGKANLHVAQYPGVEFSCGIELDHTRWSMGMHCLNACLDEQVKATNNSF